MQLLAGGGAIAEVAPEATAAWHRDARALVQFDGYWTSPQDEAATVGWVRDLRRAMLPYADGAYVNYHDADLGSGYVEAYFGDHADRLRAVKRRFDPEGTFRFPQSVPTD